MSTYTPIASVTLSSAQSSVTFSGIPQTYTDLVLVATTRADTSTFNNMNFPQVQFNGDTGSTYSNTTLYSRNTGGGWSALSTRSSNTDGINSGGIATTSFGSSIFSTYIVNVMNYTNTTTNKTVIARVGTGGDLTNMDGTSANVGLWRNTAAITSLRIVASSSGNFVSGSTFNLYGVANASITNVAKATGGDSVTTDGTYWYHTFRSSGTFTPTQALTCDYLVVAGGGAGGYDQGGGGGAGGYRTSIGGSALSLIAQNYTVTVGAGASQTGNPATSANGSNSVFASITSSGGGGGKGYQQNGVAGGSGSGAGGPNNGTFTLTGGAGNAGSYSPVEGYAGGNSSGTNGDFTYTTGGGGGAGAVGGNATGGTGGVSGNGGAGVANSISGTSVTYAGGGGGGCYRSHTQTPGTGGAGGGGNGGGTAGTVAGTAGAANTGSGGGGGSGNGGTGGAGGSGIVIVRYAV